ncbi:MAG: RNA-binding S4 domain-containing protein [Bacteroidetes bacterium]|nr:RNA-binding S4 domain-containing protein [Bacteroidota bacterium]
MEDGVRIDKWLWSVRIFKTRNQATQACKAGKVKISDHAVKPSREIRIGEVITVSLESLKKSVKILALAEHLLGAKLVTEYMEDLTKEEEYMKLKLRREGGSGYRLRGLGRPTKKDRRELEILKKYLGA